MALAIDLLSRVRDLIQDIEGARYTDAELIRWANDAQNETVRIAPRAYSGFIDMQLSAGSIQQIPSSAVKLISVFCNGSLSSQDKVPIQTDMNTLNRSDPGWRSTDSTGMFDHYVIEENLEQFHVYPPSSGTGTCVIEAGLQPTALEDIFSSIDLDEKYLPMLTNYVAAKALAKDAEHVNESNLAKDYLKQFYDGVVATVQTTTRGQQ